MKKIKIAQIGAAHLHAGATYKTILKLNDIFELVGFAVPDDEQNESVPFYMHKKDAITHTVDEIFDIPDLDAVAIDVSEKNLSKYALMAIEKGLHVYMDKPGGSDPVEFERLIEAVKRSKKIFYLGYMYRYNPAFIELLEKVRRGDIGEVYSIDAQMSCYSAKNTREWLGELPGGMMYNLGCHLVDMIFQIQGEPDEVVPLNASSEYEGLSSKDIGLAAMIYKNGVSTVKTCALERGGYGRRRFLVCGTKGTVELCPIERDATDTHNDSMLVTDVYETYSDAWVTVPEKHTTDVYDRYADMFISFAESVRGEKESPYTPDYELTLYKTLMKCCAERKK